MAALRREVGSQGRILSDVVWLTCGTSSGFRVGKGLRRLAGVTTGRRRMVRLSRQQMVVAFRAERQWEAQWGKGRFERDFLSK